MKMTNNEILSMIEGINETKVMEKNLPMKIGYALSKNAIACQTALKPYTEVRIKVLSKYANKDEKGNPKVINGRYDIDLSNTDLISELEELGNTEIDIEIYKVSESELDKCDSDKYDSLTPKELLILNIMFEK